MISCWILKGSFFINMQTIWINLYILNAYFTFEGGHRLSAHWQYNTINLYMYLCDQCKASKSLEKWRYSLTPSLFLEGHIYTSHGCVTGLWRGSDVSTKAHGSLFTNNSLDQSQTGPTRSYQGCLLNWTDFKVIIYMLMLSHARVKTANQNQETCMFIVK